jgi:FXSXX-COOH protein
VSVDGGSPTGDARPEWQSTMPDVSEMSLSELAEGSVLEQALRRVAADAARPDEPIAGFNSAL